MEAQAGNNLMEIVTENKLLSFNHEKSGYMVVGTKKVRTELEKELEEFPLILSGNKMNRVNEYNYLGTWISSQGVSESVILSVKKKAVKVKQMIFEIKAVVDDCSNKTPGGLLTALHIWEGAVIPYLYSALEMWLEMLKSALDTLNSLQETFLRTMLCTPRTTPLVALYWDTGTPLAVNRLLEMKLRFYFHLVHLETSSVALRIYKCQRRMKIGFVKECLEILALLGIKEEEVFSNTLVSWKKMLAAKIKDKNRKDLLHLMKSYQKIDYFERKNEDFELKDYIKNMTLENCRVMFGLRSKMTRTIKTHFFSDKEYAKSLWLCTFCESKIDTIFHAKNCIFLAKIRQKYQNLDCDDQLMGLFKDILKNRDAKAQNG